jgi:DNA polymerase III subunit gamma/tau
LANAIKSTGQSPNAAISASSLTSTVKVPSLNSLKSNLKSPAPTSEISETKEEVKEERKENENFTTENLNHYWKIFAEKKRSEGFTYEYTILNQEVDLLEDCIVEVKLSNPLQEDILERFRAELMVFLRTSLKNTNLKLKAVLVQETGRKMIYTPQEKFNYLAEKQPLLREMQRRMMLDTDF